MFRRFVVVREREHRVEPEGLEVNFEPIPVFVQPEQLLASGHEHPYDDLAYLSSTIEDQESVSDYGERSCGNPQEQSTYKIVKELREQIAFFILFVHVIQRVDENV
jgi:hypothetical protein